MEFFIIKLCIYALSLLLSAFGLNALDFNKIIKQNRVVEARVLYFILLIVFTYIIGQFVISVMYYI